MSTERLLAQRGATHGAFSSNAHYAQTLRKLFRTSSQWARMSEVEAEALDMIASKLCRILSAPFHADNWADLAGYATLVEKFRPQPAPDAEENLHPSLRGHNPAKRVELPECVPPDASINQLLESGSYMATPR
jgi:hypothetical protein